MPSPEGRGIARRRLEQAWAGDQKAARPVVEPAASWLAVRMTEDVVGFWLLWHLHGGYEGLRELGMSRSGIYRRIGLFRRAFGAHPDEFEFPGVTINVEEYLAAGQREPSG